MEFWRGYTGGRQGGGAGGAGRKLFHAASLFSSSVNLDLLSLLNGSCVTMAGARNLLVCTSVPMKGAGRNTLQCADPTPPHLTRATGSFRRRRWRWR